MEAELLSVEVSDRKEEMGLSEKKQNLEERTWNRENVKMAGGREKAYCSQWCHLYSRKRISNS